jgi:hypothetical protein
VLRIMLARLLTSAPLLINLAPHSSASFLLPPSVLAAISSRLCNNIVVIQAMHLNIQDDAHPYLNSSTPLLANLTILQIGTVCGNSFVMVRAANKRAFAHRSFDDES